MILFSLFYLIILLVIIGASFWISKLIMPFFDIDNKEEKSYLQSFLQLQLVP